MSPGPRPAARSTDSPRDVPKPCRFTASVTSASATARISARIPPSTTRSGSRTLTNAAMVRPSGSAQRAQRFDDAPDHPARRRSSSRLALSRPGGSSRPDAAQDAPAGRYRSRRSRGCRSGTAGRSDRGRRDRSRRPAPTVRAAERRSRGCRRRRRFGRSGRRHPRSRAPNPAGARRALRGRRRCRSVPVSALPSRSVSKLGERDVDPFEVGRLVDPFAAAGHRPRDADPDARGPAG